MATVVIRLEGGQEVVAAITKDSAESLGLAAGDAVTAVIKATEVRSARISRLPPVWCVPDRGGDVVADGDVIEPAAGGISGGSVESADVGFEVDHRGAVDDIDSGEADRSVGDVEQLDEAKADGIDPAGASCGENADSALAGSEQKGDLFEFPGPLIHVAGLVKPGQKPSVGESFQALQTVSVAWFDLDPALFGPVERRLDRGVLERGAQAADHADDGYRP
jgi:hypothetical protein